MVGTPGARRRASGMASGGKADWEPALGRSLRALRREKGFTLTTLGRETGLSPSFLSQFERGLTRASLSSLALIADALGSSAAALLAEAQQEDTDTVCYVGASEGVEVRNAEGIGISLVRGRRAMQPLLLVGGPQEFGDYVVHSGDEFVHVFSGRAQYDLVGEGLYDLGPGDSLYYRAGTKHRWRQLGKRPCRFIAVLMDH